MKELQAIVGHLCAARAACVLGTLVTVEGSSYRRPGARMLVTDKRTRIGSISGGCLEEDLLERSAQVAESGRAELVLYDTTAENDLLWGVGLGCHGVVRILLERVSPRTHWAFVLAENLRAGRETDLAVVWESTGGALGTTLGSEPTSASLNGEPGVFHETVSPPTSLAIFGAGDDAQPLARLAQELGWKVTIADPRPAMATEARFPGAFRLAPGPAEELVGRVAPPSGSLAVVMTHHYKHDLPILRHLLVLPLAYLGLLGPKLRADRILADIGAEGIEITPAMRRRLHAPVGLDLGGDGPDEVALSIIAEMAAILSRRDGRPLRERELPIHA